MLLDAAAYFTRRALWQFDRASEAVDEDVAGIHVKLSTLYLQHALSEAEEALGEEPEKVMALRIVA